MPTTKPDCEPSCSATVALGRHSLVRQLARQQRCWAFWWAGDSVYAVVTAHSKRLDACWRSKLPLSLTELGDQGAVVGGGFDQAVAKLPHGLLVVQRRVPAASGAGGETRPVGTGRLRGQNLDLARALGPDPALPGLNFAGYRRTSDGVLVLVWQEREPQALEQQPVVTRLWEFGYVFHGSAVSVGDAGAAAGGGGRLVAVWPWRWLARCDWWRCNQPWPPEPSVDLMPMPAHWLGVQCLVGTGRGQQSSQELCNSDVLVRPRLQGSSQRAQAVLTSMGRTWPSGVWADPLRWQVLWLECSGEPVCVRVRRRGTLVDLSITLRLRAQGRPGDQAPWPRSPRRVSSLWHRPPAATTRLPVVWLSALQGNSLWLVRFGHSAPRQAWLWTRQQPALCCAQAQERLDRGLEAPGQTGHAKDCVSLLRPVDPAQTPRWYVTELGGQFWPRATDSEPPWPAAPLPPPLTASDNAIGQAARGTTTLTVIRWHTGQTQPVVAVH